MGETEGWAKVLRRAVPAGGAALVGTLRLPAIDATWVLKRSLLSRIAEQRLPNIRIIQHDVVDVLQEMIAPGALDGVHCFFPDPWPKKRHHKRRLIQPPFVALLASRMKPGAVLHACTDWEDYAAQMLEVFSAEPALANTAAGYCARPETRPQTKFERRGLDLGHRVHDLVFRKR